MSDAKNHETVMAIKEFKDTYGYPPSIRKLGELLGLSSPASTHERVRDAEQAGLIKRRGPTKWIVIVEDES